MPFPQFAAASCRRICVSCRFFLTGCEKDEIDKQDGRSPREGERVIQQRERGSCAENCANPDNAEYTRAKHRADCRVQRTSAAAQNASRNLVEIAERLKEQNAQDTHTGAFDHSGLRRKKSGEEIPEQDDHENRDRAAYDRGDEAQPQDTPAAFPLTGGMILAGEGSRRLHGGRYLLCFISSDVLRNQNVCANGQAGGDCNNQRDDLGIGSNRRKRAPAAKVADDGG